MKISNEIYEKAVKLTRTDFEAQKQGEERIVDEETVECMLDELMTEYEGLKMKYDSLQEDLVDNYRKLNPDELGWNYEQIKGI